MKVFDLMLDDELDLHIRGGDLVVGESTLQHQALLLLTNQGEWRAQPMVGVGLNRFLLDDADAGEQRQVVRKQFELDGMQVKKLVLGEGMPEVEASYINAVGI